jgi:hypothetical protein
VGVIDNDGAELIAMDFWSCYASSCVGNLIIIVYVFFSSRAINSTNTAIVLTFPYAEVRCYL